MAFSRTKYLEPNFKTGHSRFQIRPPRVETGQYLKALTVRHIYYPLAQSSGKLFELLKALKVRDSDRAKKLFQFLNKIGARALRIQLGGVDSKDSLLGANQIQGFFLGGSLGCEGPFGFERRGMGADGAADHRSA